MGDVRGHGDGGIAAGNRGRLVAEEVKSLSPSLVSCLIQSCRSRQQSQLATADTRIEHDDAPSPAKPKVAEALPPE